MGEKLPKMLRTLSDTATVGRPKIRKPKPGEPIQISITVDGALVQALDGEAERISGERPGMRLTRADIVRIALNEWLASRSHRGK